MNNRGLFSTKLLVDGNISPSPIEERIGRGGCRVRFLSGDPRFDPTWHGKWGANRDSHKNQRKRNRESGVPV